MQTTPPRDLFIESLSRCAVKADFLPTFYQLFLSSSDEVREMFQHTDFEQQNKMLIKTLRLSYGVTLNDPDSPRDLRERAESHDRHHLNIRPELYDLWREALVQAAEKSDPDWNEQTEKAWREILTLIINRMIKYY